MISAGDRAPQREAAAARLYRQAQQAPGWDPLALDLSTDARHWSRLTAAERDLLLRLTALFHAGEEGMTRDAAPLVVAVAREGRVEEQLFLGTLITDEAKHTRFFRRVLDDVCRAPADLSRYRTPAFRALFDEDLPRLMGRLRSDPSPGALAEAVVAYSVVSEGVLSETGHHLYAAAMRHRGLMPGLLDGLARVRRDEARHMTFGVYLLCRLVTHDSGVWAVIERCMNDLLAHSLAIVSEFFEAYEVVPFGLTLQDTVTYAMSRFARRAHRIERAREGGPAMVDAGGDPTAELVEWVAERVEPLPVMRREGDAGALTLEVRHGERAAALMIAPEVLDHFLAEEIVGALDECAVPARLGEPGVRLVCIEGSGRIVVRTAA